MYSVLRVFITPSISFLWQLSISSDLVALIVPADDTLIHTLLVDCDDTGTLQGRQGQDSGGVD
jgi:hypothetical protein